MDVDNRMGRYSKLDKMAFGWVVGTGVDDGIVSIFKS
jgi:hypothetical protein